MQAKLTTICDNLVLLQRSIAGLVWEWNQDLQEFVAQQKKSEKTKVDTKSEIKATSAAKPTSSTGGRGSVDTVRNSDVC